MPCSLYHCRVLVGRVLCSYLQVLGIRYFQINALHIIVVHHASQLGLSFALI